MKEIVIILFFFLIVIILKCDINQQTKPGGRACGEESTYDIYDSSLRESSKVYSSQINASPESSIKAKMFTLLFRIIFPVPRTLFGMWLALDK